MPDKIAEDLAEGDRILFHTGGPEATPFTVVSRHVFDKGGIDQVSVLAKGPDDRDRMIPAAYGQKFEVPAW